mmetsp:Transcript_1866/g.4288  ORF Transcript_1866/g.4288 Transcript_1866/m.4288 type:complete len:1872 (-) Transcript_1866:313-5928(-)|eukprot:CAMPEP_0114488542 /NCGR_PEP_ID=MMETSP0109-20121206/1390_1 /TAXON_ID=29199 /ORGANISM="Chlorarachnion reptans, Strain CCCM449" /LENGTH=1871 /DNA_ID=CAMNT_0001664951 /DNA_START=304 /DNA_END=5919 /DNA_ORIENTATION=+
MKEAQRGAKRDFSGEKGASLDDRTSALVYQARTGDWEAVLKLVDTGEVPTQIVDELFLASAEYGHLELLRVLIHKVTSLECVNENGQGGLTLAACNGHTDVMRVLIKAKAALDTQCHQGFTPILAAIQCDQERAASQLCLSKANLHVTTVHQQTPMHLAASKGMFQLMALLLENKASMNALSVNDESPLEVAKDSATCRWMLEWFCKNSGLEETEDKGVTSPFKDLPPGPASYLFWTAMGVGKDSYMFQNFGVYPFDRLNDTERIIVLTEVAEGMSGYKSNLRCNILNESALYAVFALMKARIDKELDRYPIEEDPGTVYDSGTPGTRPGSNPDDEAEECFLWRKRVLAAFEQVYNTNASLVGLSAECWRPLVWDTVVNVLARSLFGECFWEKKALFLSPNSMQRPVETYGMLLPRSYFTCNLPSTASVEIQLTFKKLITMSKSFLCDEPIRPSGCFCQDCIAELELPLKFKLQFLEEAAEEKRKSKKNRKGKERQLESAENTKAHRRKLHDLVLNHRKELRTYWSSLSLEERWCLAEMTTAELTDIIAASPYWETLRAGLESYAQYAWEEDVLEITEDYITIADDICEDRGIGDMLEAMLDAVELNRKCEEDMEQMFYISPERLEHISEDEWDKRGRQMLETLILAEFACKIAAQYLVKKEESRAQQVALELELELLKEEQQQTRAAERKAAKRKRAKKKKRAQRRLKKEAEIEEQKRMQHEKKHPKTKKHLKITQDTNSSSNDRKLQESKSKVASASGDATSSTKGKGDKTPKSSQKDEEEALQKDASSKRSGVKVGKNGKESSRKVTKNGEKGSRASGKNPNDKKVKGDSSLPGKDRRSLLTRVNLGPGGTSNPFAMLNPGNDEKNSGEKANENTSTVASTKKTVKKNSTASSQNTQTVKVATGGKASSRSSKQEKGNSNTNGTATKKMAQPLPRNPTPGKTAASKVQQSQSPAKENVSSGNASTAPKKRERSPTSSSSSKPENSTGRARSSSASAVKSTVNHSNSERTGWDRFEDALVFWVPGRKAFKECVERKAVPLPQQCVRMARHVKPRGTAVFIYSANNHALHGIFEATRAAIAENVAKGKGGGVAGHVEFRSLSKSMEPVGEAAVRGMFENGTRVRRLEGKRVRELITLFLRQNQVLPPLTSSTNSSGSADAKAGRPGKISSSTVPNIVKPRISSSGGGVTNVWKMREATRTAASRQAPTSQNPGKFGQQTLQQQHQKPASHQNQAQSRLNKNYTQKHAMQNFPVHQNQHQHPHRPGSVQQQLYAQTHNRLHKPPPVPSHQTMQIRPHHARQQQQHSNVMQPQFQNPRNGIGSQHGVMPQEWPQMRHHAQSDQPGVPVNVSSHTHPKRTPTKRQMPSQVSSMETGSNDEQSGTKVAGGLFTHVAQMRNANRSNWTPNANPQRSEVAAPPSSWVGAGGRRLQHARHGLSAPGETRGLSGAAQGYGMVMGFSSPGISRGQPSGGHRGTDTMPRSRNASYPPMASGFPNSGGTAIQHPQHAAQATQSQRGQSHIQQNRLNGHNVSGTHTSAGGPLSRASPAASNLMRAPNIRSSHSLQNPGGMSSRHHSSLSHSQVAASGISNATQTVITDPKRGVAGSRGLGAPFSSSSHFGGATSGVIGGSGSTQPINSETSGSSLHSQAILRKEGNVDFKTDSDPGIAPSVSKTRNDGLSLFGSLNDNSVLWRSQASGIGGLKIGGFDGSNLWSRNGQAEDKSSQLWSARGVGGSNEDVLDRANTVKAATAESLGIPQKKNMAGEAPGKLKMSLELNQPSLGLRAFSSSSTLLQVGTSAGLDRSAGKRFDTTKDGAETTIPGYKALGGLSGLNLGIWGGSGGAQGAGMWGNEDRVIKKGWGNKEGIGEQAKS